jgi:hypothetical protein
VVSAVVFVRQGGAVCRLQGSPCSVESMEIESHGLPWTLGLQWIAYPLIAVESQLWQHRGGFSPMVADSMAGISIAPLCAMWKTRVLQSSDARKTHYFRALPFWAVRNSIVAPAIFGGRKYTDELLAWANVPEHSIPAQIARAMMPAAIATAVSHPCDLLTGLLNGDPHRHAFRTSMSAVRSLVATRGFWGFAVAFPARFAAFAVECNLFPWLLAQFPAQVK